MKSGLTVGVVSSHGHEMGHVTVWDKLPEVKEIHVCGISDGVDPADIASLSPKVVATTNDLTELLSENRLDAVGMCVRPDLGPKTLTEIINAGVPVLYDKPGAKNNCLNGLVNLKGTCSSS